MELDETIIKVLKEKLTFEVDIHVYFSNVHNIITTVKLGDEIISQTTKQCNIGYPFS